MTPAGNESFTAHAVPAPFVGGRRRSAKKMRLVKKKTVRRMLKKMGLKMRGGATDMAAPKALGDAVEAAADAPEGGAVPVEDGAADVGGRRRRKHHSSKKSHRRSRHRKSIFGY